MTNTLTIARKALRAGTALHALALLGAGVGMTAIAAPAAAQDYTNVTASGRVQGTDGQPIAGATVEIRSNQGYNRTLTTDSSGSFRAPQVPPGTYSFSISAPGYDSFTDDSVSLSQSGAANQFTLAKAGEASGGDIVVTAGRVQVADFEKTTTGAVINVGELATRVPVSRSLRDVILLAPGTIQGGSAQNSAFAGQATISGSSFAENAYYINGLNVTEFRQGFSPVAIPFDFYQTVEVKSGGFQAEFGRATGGVVNATTKSGSNDFHASVLFNWEPNDLTGKGKNTYASDNDGDYHERQEFIAQLSGPIIKDHLFFYGLYNTRSITDRNGSAQVPASQLVQQTRSPFYGGKIDGLLWGQHLEFTYFNTTSLTYNRTFNYDPATNAASAFSGGSSSRAGGENYVGRYTGTITNWLTVSGAYGINKNRAGTIPLDATNPYVENDIDTRNIFRVPASNTSSSITTNDDKREFYRGDVDVSVKLLGDHHFRFGYDHEKLTATQITGPIGGGFITIYRTAAAGGFTGLPAGTIYVGQRFFQNGGAFNTINEAYYGEDSWSLFSNRLTLQLGIRNDRFDNRSAANTSFYKSGDQWGPRLGFTLDPIGDGRTKLYGSFGRYFLPIAANTNIRSAGAETDYTRYNLATLAANGLPIIGAPIVPLVGGAACPDTGTANCLVVRVGEVADPSSLQAQGLKPQSQDEYILGGEQRFGQRIKLGAYFTYRKLNRVLEDAAIDIAAGNYCVSKGFTRAQCGTPSSGLFRGFNQYVLINPGEDATITLSGRGGLGLPDGTNPTVTFTAAQLGYPKAKRTYKAMTLTADREFDGKWSASASYTIAADVGNYEGGVKSDIGQADSGATEDFDQPGFTVGSYGYLPNHRRHTLKAYGSYQIGEFLTIGANGILQSPKKFGCIGVVPSSVDPYASQYQGGGFFCYNDATATTSTLTPRGRSFQSAWRKQVDLSVSLRVPADFDATLRFDVFNVLNDQSALDYDEIGDAALNVRNDTYGQPLTYNAPRAARVQLRVGF